MRDVINDVINGAASEYEMPRNPNFYRNDSGLPQTDLDIPMPNVRWPISSGDKICSTCNKEDVCMYKTELEQVIKEITRTSENVSVFIDINIKCKKWTGKVVSYRSPQYESGEY